MEDIATNQMNDVPLANEASQKPPSLLVTAFWAVALFIIPSAIIGFAFGVYTGAVGIEDSNAWFAKVEVMVAMTFCIYFLVLPMLWALVKGLGDGSSFKRYLNVEQHTASQWLQIAIFTVLFWGLFTLLGFVLNIPEEPFMQQLKYSSLPVWFICLNVCVLAPIVEELVFRGFLFKRIELTKLGVWGAAIVTSLLFASIHGQYSVTGIAMVFLLGLYFTWIRVKFKSTSLCIAGHAVCNSLTMIALYLFM